MAAFVGDGFLEDPIRVLVVGNSNNAAAIEEAVAAVADRFEIDTCGTLQEAGGRIGIRDYDVAVLTPPLPDAWLADAYSSFTAAGASAETLILLDAMDDAASMKRATHPPFAVVDKAHLTPELVRRLLLSAALYKRAFADAYAPEALLQSDASRG